MVRVRRLFSHRAAGLTAAMPRVTVDFIGVPRSSLNRCDRATTTEPSFSPGRPRAASRRSRWRWPSARRRRHQRQFHAGLSRPARHHRAADAGGGGARAASALRPCRRRRELFGRPLVRRCAGGDRAGSQRAGRLPILVGGTGLYFKALTQGLAAVPPVPADIRAAVRARLAAEGVAPLHAGLRGAIRPRRQRLMPGDRSRIARALEVVLATGRPLADWHREGMPAVDSMPRSAVKIFLDVERAELYRRIDARFDAMLAAGALDEVGALGGARLDPSLPAMKAHGVPWLIRHLAARSRSPRRPKAASATRAATPSVRPPGSATSCRTGPG